MTNEMKMKLLRDLGTFLVNWADEHGSAEDRTGNAPTHTVLDGTADELWPLCEVLSFANASSYDGVLRGWIDAGYFPEMHEVQGNRRFWKRSHLYAWQAWVEAKPYRKSKTTWSNWKIKTGSMEVFTVPNEKG